MLEIRPICENCAKPLPNESDEAMICSFECTFCADCANGFLDNVCPNCGGGFSKRPTRPTKGVTKYSTINFPPITEKLHNPVDMEKFKALHDTNGNVNPRER
ncbi:DUF1272 domain-containing protein [Maribacter sp. 2308TA10-17]|uniref:DUF1272 domain-containing protein n=1 Tax=Maribacter sp. 2308TA10-17 TaxID=3386276 RepID=UPI0039BC2B60